MIAQKLITILIILGLIEVVFRVALKKSLFKMVFNLTEKEEDKQEKEITDDEINEKILELERIIKERKGTVEQIAKEIELSSEAKVVTEDLVGKERRLRVAEEELNTAENNLEQYKCPE